MEKEHSVITLSSALQKSCMTPTQVFSSKYCEMLQITYFEKNLQTAASELSKS